MSVNEGLDGLSSVDWTKLHHAYGTAEDVPGQVRALRSADGDERGRALHELYGNVYHQGTRWQASGHVVPFLAGLVDDPATPDRVAVLGLLRAVALGDCDDTWLPFDPGRAFAQASGVTDGDVAKVLDWLYGGAAEEDGSAEKDGSAEEGGEGGEGDEAGKGREGGEDVADAVAAAWDRDAYLAAAAISDRFAAWLDDRDPMIAANAAELVTWFPATEPVISRLLRLPAAGGYEVARASANLSLAYLAPDDPAIDGRLTELLAAESPGVRLTAAVALAFRIGDLLPDAGLQALAEARDHTAELDARMFPIPWDRSLLGFAALALQRIGLSP
ncbi:hypothetical protein AB0K12_47020 [Nonomuraea sp. NPDC049419]|uniref:hypothetical protein n=1 Tax=Nonomuraea sp. NPDC049419 TaxID=3155772 RepID=UPI0034420FF8